MHCVHIGFPKAASTTLQRGLFANQDDLFYLGKSPRGQEGGYVSPAAAELSWRLNTSLSASERAGLRASFERSILPLARGKPVALSRELLCGGGPRRARKLAGNIREVMGPTRVVLVLRDPLPMIESLYFQRLQENNARRSERDRDELTGYFTIEEWLREEERVPHQRHLRLLKPDEILAPHVEALGRENVGVFLFERLCEDADAFMREVCAFVGIDPDRGARSAAGVHNNVRITSAHVDRLKRLQRTPRRARLFANGSVAECRRLMGLTRTHRFWDAPKASAGLSEEWKARLRARARDGFRSVGREWGLPLERYGYPV